MPSLKPIANILVVDDEPDILKVLLKGLQMNGFKASGYTDASLALSHLREHSKEYCAVLSDIRMPGVTGFQVARETKKINPELKIILMSAFEVQTSDFEKVMPSTSVDDFIQKPTSIATIKNVLLKHIAMTKSLADNTEQNDEKTATEWLRNSKYGEHSMLVYSSLDEFREIYSDYCKIALQNNEIVLLIPHYETIGSVREALKEKIDVAKCEVDGMLTIVDTEQAFQKSNDIYNILLMINQLTKRAETLQKNGISMIADAGSFFLHENLAELVKHELSIPPELGVRCKALCCYHKNDFDSLSEQQKKALLDHHNRTNL